MYCTSLLCSQFKRWLKRLGKHENIKYQSLWELLWWNDEKWQGGHTLLRYKLWPKHLRIKSKSVPVMLLPLPSPPSASFFFHQDKCAFIFLIRNAPCTTAVHLDDSKCLSPHLLPMPKSNKATLTHQTRPHSSENPESSFSLFLSNRHALCSSPVFHTGSAVNVDLPVWFQIEQSWPELQLIQITQFI